MPCSAIHTSFSLNDKRFEEFGEGDRPVADTELLVLLVACLGILLLYCIACLYAFCMEEREIRNGDISNRSVYFYNLL